MNHQIYGRKEALLTLHLQKLNHWNTVMCIKNVKSIGDLTLEYSFKYFLPKYQTETERLEI